MEHTPTRGDTIVLDGKSQTLECVRLRFDAHDELVAALNAIIANGTNSPQSTEDRLADVLELARAALAKVKT